MAFDPAKALSLARALARPRRVESAAIDIVEQEIASQLEALGFGVERERFRFTRAFEAVLLSEIALALSLVTVALLLAPAAPVVGVVLPLLFVVLQPLNRLIHSRAVAPADSGPAWPLAGKSLLSQYKAANIVARPRARPPSAAAPQLYLVAHYDSKSQRVSLIVRMALMGAFIASILLFSATALFSQPSGLLALVAWATGLPLLFVGVGDSSPGAIDNASGVGLLLHLAEVLNARPGLLARVGVTWLFTSAEELAVLGAIYHARRHAHHLKLASALFILNLDGIGANGRLSYVADDWGSALADMVKDAGRELGYPVSRMPAVGALFDHIPFAGYLGYNHCAISLLTAAKDSWVIHTPADTPDRLHPRGFEMAGRVALKVIEKLAALADG